MQCGYYTVHKQMSEKHIFSLLPFFILPLFFLFSCLRCFSVMFLSLFRLYFFSILLSSFFQDKLKGLCERIIFLYFLWGPFVITLLHLQ